MILSKPFCAFVFAVAVVLMALTWPRVGNDLVGTIFFGMQAFVAASQLFFLTK